MNQRDTSDDSADRPLSLMRFSLLRRLLFRQLPAEEAKAVRDSVEQDGVLTERYVLMCALSAGIATLGLLQSSTAVVIGAMLVSPLMSPIARLGFAFASFDGRRAEQAAKVLGVGIASGVAIGMLLTWASPIRNATPEIIARTAPTLLDLAVAVLSGLAGGYATVHRKGETAIGVAIATALMPPLATLGYSLATARFDFAAGAVLLFLTNLAAISFSFAIVARIRGVARPFNRVDFGLVHTLAFVFGFLLLATPLALTLHRVTQEAAATRAARSIIVDELKIEPSQLAQLSARWASEAGPQIAATAVVTDFTSSAPDAIRARLVEELKSPVDLDLRQIVATDPRAQAQAIVEAALAQMPANLQARSPVAAPVEVQTPPPIAAITSASRITSIASWPEDTRRVVHVLAAPAGEFTLTDYRAEEERLNALGFNWNIEIIPPFLDRITVAFADDQTRLDDTQTTDLEVARWALIRWAASDVVVEGFSGRNDGAAARRLALARAESVAAALGQVGASQPIARAAASETALRLMREAGHVRAADILPFASQRP